MSPVDDIQAHLDSGASRITRRVWGALLFGFGGFMVWAAFAPLPGGVVVPGIIAVSGNRKSVEAKTAGVIEHIKVSEGQAVAQGDVLVQIDPTTTDARLQSLHVRYTLAKLAAARLRAELGDSTPLDEYRHASSDVPQLSELQRELLAHNMQAEAQARRGMEAELASAVQKRRAATLVLESRRAQLASLSEQLDSMTRLMSEGYLPRNRWLEARREHLAMQSAIAQENALSGEMGSTIERLQARLDESSHSFDANRLEKLVQLEHESQALASEVAAAQASLHATELRAPEAGMVVGLAVHTVGGVVQPGQVLMEIVPSAQELEVEARLPVDRVDEIKTGAAVDLFFSAFDRNRTPKRDGVVKRVSADRILDERSGESYYTIVVAVAPHREHEGNAQKLKPGMPVEVFIKTAERTLLGYLIKPLVDKGRTGWDQGE